MLYADRAIVSMETHGTRRSGSRSDRDGDTIEDAEGEDAGQPLGDLNSRQAGSWHVVIYLDEYFVARHSTLAISTLNAVSGRFG